jgi:hypothetical protein
VLASTTIDDAGLEGRSEGEITGGASAVVASTGPTEDMGYGDVPSQAVDAKETPSEEVGGQLTQLGGAVSMEMGALALV